jgi:hypothetical protein
MTSYLTNKADNDEQTHEQEQEHLNLLLNISTILQTQAHSIVGSVSHQVSPSCQHTTQTLL